MGATNHTPNLNLPQFIGSDKPSWLGDVNNAFSSIDSGFGQLQETTTSVIAYQIKDLQDTVALHTDGILENAKDIAVNTASIGALQTHIVVLDADLETLDKRELSHFSTLQNNIDLNNKAVSDIEDDNIYIKKNMDKIESDVIITTASVAAYKVAVDNLDRKVDTFDGRINNNAADISTAQAQINVLTQRADRADTRLDALENKDIVTTSSITSLDARIQPLEILPVKVAEVAQEATDNAADIASLQNKDVGHTTAIQALQTKTNNITNGVQVPFGFGVDASGNRGFLQPDGRVQPFFTDVEWNALQDDLNDTSADVSDLQAKTSGITPGMTLPYSLAIAPGGAYGYKRNGEQGVTPFVTKEDVDKIVDLAPIEADVQTLKTDTQALQTKTAPLEITVSDTGNRFAVDTGAPNAQLKIVNGTDGSTQLTIGDSTNVNNIKLPFGFGVDAQGNYGYIKAGADTVTPFNNITPYKMVAFYEGTADFNPTQTIKYSRPPKIAADNTADELSLYTFENWGGLPATDIDFGIITAGGIYKSLGTISRSAFNTPNTALIPGLTVFENIVEGIGLTENLANTTVCALAHKANSAYLSIFHGCIVVGTQIIIV